MASNFPSRHPEFPSRRIEQLTRPFVQFMHVESAGGIVLLACTALALFLANSQWADAYHHFWEQPLSIGVAELQLSHSLEYWINDALMVVFFFVIGLEIKREMVTGELSQPNQLVLPVAAALGGVIVPVLVYLSRQLGQAGQDGWAVPMATDIAFVVGCMALLGKRIPHGLKILMLSLAIVDDLAAVAVIAVFYTAQIHWLWLGGAFAGFVTIAILNRTGVRAISIYVAMGILVWFCTLESGVHPTIAGVLLGLLTPVEALLPEKGYLSLLVRTYEQLSNGKLSANERRSTLADLAFATQEAVPPVVRLESALHPWVAFVIMPVFALANAGVAIDAEAFGQPVAVAVTLGLFAGKATGIFLASWLTIKLGWTALPSGVSWGSLLGAAFLGGIGFTMALFIAALGLEGALLDAAKVGVVMGSFVSALVGMLILSRASPRLA